MPDRSLRYSWLVVGLLTFAIYAHTLNDGLILDDLVFVHGYSTRDVLHAFVAPWHNDPRVSYYRPGAIVLFALRSWILGAQPTALHALNLLLTIGVVWLFGHFLFVWHRSAVTAWAGMILLLAHPYWSTSAVSWITNQMHLVEVGLVLAACWLAVKAPERWPWLLVLQACALTLKEDAVMLAPSLAILWGAIGVRPRWRWAVGSAVIVAAWLSIRRWAGSKLLAVSWAYSLRAATFGPTHVLTIGLTSGLVLLVAIALLAAQFVGRRALLSTVALVTLWNIPLLYATGPTRWQFLTLWTVSGVAVLIEAGVRRDRVLAGILMLVLAADWTFVNVALTQAYFAPCGILAQELGDCEPN